MTNNDYDEATKVFASADCIFDSESVATSIDQMAADIKAMYGAVNPLLLCVMNGGLIFTGELLLRLDAVVELDYVHATRYRGDTSGGELKWIRRHSADIRDRVVIVLDDILDEGITLSAIVDVLKSEGAKKVVSAVLCQKDHQRSNGFQADFVGLTVPDRYVFGYGMDYKGYLRNANGIYALATD